MAAAPVPRQLLEAREKIDAIDRRLVLLLAERFALTDEVGKLKASNDLEAVDPEREAQKLKAIRELCQQQGLNPDLVSEIFTRIMSEVVRNHRRYRSGA